MQIKFEFAERYKIRNFFFESSEYFSIETFVFYINGFMFETYTISIN